MKKLFPSYVCDHVYQATTFEFTEGLVKSMIGNLQTSQIQIFQTANSKYLQSFIHNEFPGAEQSCLAPNKCDFAAVSVPEQGEVEKND